MKQANAGRKVGLLRAELVEVKRELTGKAQSLKDESALAHRWEAAWTQEDSAGRALAEELSSARAALADAEQERDEAWADAAHLRLASSTAAHAHATVCPLFIWGRHTYIYIWINI